MSYVDHSHRPSPASMVAVIGVHAAIGAILVAGLTVTGTVPDIVTRIGATNIPVAPPPPKPPEPAEPRPAQQNDTVIHAPKPARDLVIVLEDGAAFDLRPARSPASIPSPPSRATILPPGFRLPIIAPHGCGAK